MSRPRALCVLAALGLGAALTGGPAHAAGGADGARQSPAAAASAGEDFNGDGYADLAAAVPYEAIGNRSGAGAVVLLKGGSGGLTGTGAQAFHQDTQGIPGIAETGDHFGDAVRLLDVTRDGRAELAASAPEENGTGAVWSLRGTASGLTATGSAAFNPVDLGVPAAGSRFGAVLANHTGVHVE